MSEWNSVVTDGASMPVPQPRRAKPPPPPRRSDTGASEGTATTVYGTQVAPQFNESPLFRQVEHEVCVTDAAPMEGSEPLGDLGEAALPSPTAVDLSKENPLFIPSNLASGAPMPPSRRVKPAPPKRNMDFQESPLFASEAMVGVLDDPLPPRSPEAGRYINVHETNFKLDKRIAVDGHMSIGNMIHALVREIGG